MYGSAPALYRSVYGIKIKNIHRVGGLLIESKKLCKVICHKLKISGVVANVFYITFMVTVDAIFYFVHYTKLSASCFTSATLRAVYSANSSA